MRTTIAIDDELLVTAKERGRRLGLTLGQYIERALRHAAAHDLERGDVPPPISVFTGRLGVRPGVDLSSNRSIQEFLDEGLPIEKLR